MDDNLERKGKLNSTVGTSNIKRHDIDVNVSTPLSGGNQQKVLLARVGYLAAGHPHPR